MATADAIHPINGDAWEEWVQYRSREKKKKIGPMAEVKQKKLLAQYDMETQQQMIDTSIQNSWQGLFPPKEQHNGLGRSSRSHTRGPRIISLGADADTGYVNDGRSYPQLF